MRLLVTKSDWDSGEESSPTPLFTRAQLLLPIVLAVLLSILFPGTAPLLGAVMLGNLLRASTRTSHLADTVKDTIYPVILFLLALTIGGAMTPTAILTSATLKILVLAAIGVTLNALIWVLGVRYAGRWLGTQSQDVHSDLLASLLAAGAILGVAALIP
jgi:Na+-transporting methylmalonyl-CoA/oxaloacetate decarboxylase beta subunit